MAVLDRTNPHPAYQENVAPQHATEFRATAPDGNVTGSTGWLKAFSSGWLNSHITRELSGLHVPTLRGAEGGKMGKQRVYDLRWVYVVHKKNAICDHILSHQC